MSWLKNIFTKTDPQKIFNTVASGVDKLFFTNEEKAEMNKEIIKANADFVSTSLSENSIRSKTRRYIAISIVFTYLFLVLLGVIVYYFNIDYSKFIFEVVKELSMAFITVLAFYFGSSMLRMNKGKSS